MTPEVRCLPAGDAAVLMEAADLDTVMRLAGAIDAARETGLLADVVDVVPAARTVLVRSTPDHLAATVRTLRSLDLPEQADRVVADLQVEVRYDGPDLAAVAELTGLTVADIVARHTDTEWTVAFTGFAPGFGYLVGGDGSLHVPRRPEPRTRVPAGSVALAGEFTGIYPTASPGGWHLIGQTDLVAWDPERDPPALLVPGTRVRFVAVDS